MDVNYFVQFSNWRPSITKHLNKGRDLLFFSPTDRPLVHKSPTEYEFLSVCMCVCVCVCVCVSLYVCVCVTVCHCV